jgi:hypothetical protein
MAIFIGSMTLGDWLANWAIMSGFAGVARCASKEPTISCGELFQHI